MADTASQHPLESHILQSSYAQKVDAYFAAARPEIRALIPATVTRLLDVGCGRGEFGRALREERPSVVVTGIELTEWAVAAEANLDHVVRVDVERDDLGDLGMFDCITFNDVLEHLADPWAALRRLLPHLSPGGYVIASSPNIRHVDTLKALLIHKRFDYADSGVMDRTHLRFFTIRTFPELFESVGLSVVHSGGLNNQARLPFKFGVLNAMLFNALADTRFLQLVCISRKPG